MKKCIDKLKKDLTAAKDENAYVQQENAQQKSYIFKLEHDLDSRKEQEKVLVEQLSQNDNLLQQLQSDLRYLGRAGQQATRLLFRII
jgi:septal ring factor EnvC (AmiA/AmiB activator)